MTDKHLLPVVLAVELQQVDNAGHLVITALLLPDAPKISRILKIPHRFNTEPNGGVQLIAVTICSLPLLYREILSYLKLTIFTVVLQGEFLSVLLNFLSELSPFTLTAKLWAAFAV
jgi:hypothetical protein